MEENTSTAITAFVPHTLEGLIKFSEYLAKSELVPKDFREKPSNVLVALQWGSELGIQPMQAIQNIAVINGRPSIWGDLGLALVWASGLCEYFEEEPTPTGCTCRTRRKGTPNEQARTFTLDMAKTAKLAEKDTYKQYGARMLQWRARWWLMRDVYPDVLKGIPAAEESLDRDPEKDVTPEPIRKPAARLPEPQAPVQDAQVVDPAAGKGEPAKTAPAASTAAESAGNTAVDNKDEAPAQAHMVELVKKKLAAKTLTEPECFKRFGMDSWEGVTVGRINQILEWMLDPAKGPA